MGRYTSSSAPVSSSELSSSSSMLMSCCGGAVSIALPLPLLLFATAGFESVMFVEEVVVVPLVEDMFGWWMTDGRRL